MSAETMIPATILTGFLGAGKTTLLNRILNEQHDQRIAVIVNEFGEAGIDGGLLIQEDEQIVEMNNGCICCSVRGDLLRILGDLYTRKQSGELNFDRVIIETTGLADPGPVAQTFFIETDVRDRYLLDGIITVVDAFHGMQQLDQHDEASEQVGFADRILLSKTDLVDETTVKKLTARLRQINPRASITPVHFGNTDLGEILNMQGFLLEERLKIEPDFLQGAHHHHHHDDGISSFVFRHDQPFDMDKLEQFLGTLIELYGTDMLRYKGLLNVVNDDHRWAFQGVHMMMGGERGSPWQPDEKRESTMVFIGKDLPETAFKKGLEKCLAVEINLVGPQSN